MDRQQRLPGDLQGMVVFSGMMDKVCGLETEYRMFLEFNKKPQLIFSFIAIRS